MQASNRGRTLSELAQVTHAEIKGDAACVIYGLAPLQKAVAGQLSFLSNAQYRKYLTTTKASAVIIGQSDVERCPVNALVVKNPYVVYAKIAELFVSLPTVKAGIHPTAIMGKDCEIDASVSIGAHVVIGDGVKIGPQSVISAGCVIGDNVVIGQQTHLWSNVSIYYGVAIGNQCLIHSGVVIGSDGFGMANENGQWLKVPQLGSVTIGNAVEIGSNTTIDRGALEDTIIEDGVKLDNQIQVGHNVVIGANTAIAGCVAIAGSARIGRYCAIGGGTCIAGHLEIADHVVITGMSGVYTTIDKPGVYSSGTGVQESRTWIKNVVRLRQLHELTRKITELEKMIKIGLTQYE